jgi:uncharacterized membrane protein
MSEERPPNVAPHPAGRVRRHVANRIIGFSDGVFATAVTLLVLTVDLPTDLLSEEVGSFLWGALPQVLVYAVSFMVIGTFWLRHHGMFDT